MQDVLIEMTDEGYFDLVIDNSKRDFASVSGVETIIPVALFTDARAASSEVSDPTKRRGWVGNILTIDRGFELGSKLWLFKQERLTPEVINSIKSVVKKAIRTHVITPGIADKADIKVTKEGVAIRIYIELHKERNVIATYSTLWTNSRTDNIRKLESKA